MLLTGLLLPNMRYKRSTIAVFWPAVFVICEINVFMWLWQNGWNGSERLIWLVSAVMIGCMLLQQLFGKRHWYFFHGGSFRRERLNYDILAKKIRDYLWLQELPPASIILHYDGFLGLSALNDEQTEKLLQEIDNQLEETRWCRRGVWHMVFLLQWFFMTLMLISHVIGSI